MYSLFVEWMVVGPSLEVETGMSGFVVQRAVRSPVNIYVQEEHGPDKLKHFLNHLNSIHRCI
jgi:hypothetical protein